MRSSVRTGGRPGATRKASPIVIAGRVIAVALSAALVVYLGYLWTTVRGINDVNRVSISSLDGAGGADIDGKDQNLLIVGNDDRSTMTKAQVRELKVGYDGGSLNTDSMMIVHVPADGSKATLISLPRDSYVKIPGYGMNKLNAAYGFGYTHAKGKTLDDRIAAGASLLTTTVQNLTGLAIDHFVQVTLVGFVTISDAVGGVTVNLCRGVNDTVRHNRAVGRTGGSGLRMTKGKHTIEGVRALEFVRQREGLPNGDLDRAARQRYFLTAAFRKIASAGTLLDPAKLQRLVTAVQSSIYVDKGLNMLDLAHQMSNLSADHIVGKAIPFERFSDSPVGSVEIVNPKAVHTFVRQLVAGATSTKPTKTASPYTAAKPVAPKTVAVRVLNAGKTDGAAAASSRALDKAGFRSSVDNRTPRPESATIITYARGQESQAKTLARYVPGAAVRVGSVKTVTLTLGTDGLSAHRTPVKSAGHKHKTTKRSKAKAVDAGCIN